MKTRTILFSLSILISIGLGFLLLSVEELGLFLRFLAYPILFAGLCLWLYYAIRSQSREASLLWIKQKANIAALVACFLGTLFLYTREERGYKIVYDEPAIINTSLNLHFDRDPVLREPAYAGSEHYPSHIDKRPFFFAFVVSLFHDILGYDIANGHIVNFLFTFAFLLAVYLLLSRLSGPQTGFIGIAAFCAHPLMAQNASGLGFEIANLFMLVCAISAALSYWKHPGDRQLGFFLFSIVLLAHTRYESALYALPAGLVIISKWIQNRTVSIPLPLILCPLFFIPLAWQYRIIQSQIDGYMQLSLKGVSHTFGADYMLPNLTEALAYFSGSNQNLAGSTILGPLGLISLAIVSGYLLAKPRERILEAGLMPLALIAATTIALFLLLMAYYWGILTDPDATRLSLPLWLLMLLSLSSLLAVLAKRYKYIPHALLGLAFLHASPITANHSYFQNKPTMKRYRWIEAVIGEELNRNTLVISNMVLIFQNREIPSFNLKRFNHEFERVGLHMQLQTYESIFVVQFGHYSGVYPNVDGPINPGHEIAPMYQLEPIAEASLHPYNFTRISRLRGVDPKIAEVEKAIPVEERPYLNTKKINTFPVPPEMRKAWEKSLP